MQRTDSLEKTLTLGKTEGRTRGQQRMTWLDSITDSVDVKLGKLQEIVRDRAACHAVGILEYWTGHSFICSTNF